MRDAVGRLEAAMLLVGGAAIAGLVAGSGLELLPPTLERLRVGQLVAAYVFCLLQLAKLAFVPRPGDYFLRHLFSFALVLVILFQLVAVVGLEQTPEHAYLLRQGARAPLAAFGVAAAEVYFLLVGFAQSPFFHKALLRLRLHPTVMIMASFAAVIAAGTLLLKLPKAVVPGAELTWMEAWFTATSAAAVTGLVVVDTGSHFSIFGQTVILGLIQIGGLGVLTLTAFAAYLGGQGIRGTEEMRMAELFEIHETRGFRRTLYKVIGLTLLVEAIGAGLFYQALAPTVRDPFLRLFHAVFHAVSAFCNAGFSLYSDSLARLRETPWAMAGVMALIFAGSVGFPVLERLPSIVWKTITGRWRELPRHIRVVLGVEAAIVAVGGSLFFVLERSGLLAGWGSGPAGLTSLYMPLVGRTSGFQTMDLGSMGPAAAVLIMVLMLVGGSPASTAGGMKTTVLAAAWARLKARGGEPMLGGSPVGRAALGRAKWVAVGMLSIFAFTTVSLLFLEEGPVLPILFEATSAAGTVGLSMGATSGLSLPGRVVVIIAMFCARIAPAALALSWSIRHPETPRDEHAILVC